MVPEEFILYVLYNSFQIILLMQVDFHLELRHETLDQQ